MRALVATGLATLVCVGGGAARAADCTAIVPVTEVVRHVAAPDPALTTPPAGERLAVPDRLPLALRTERSRLAYTLDVAPCAATPAAALWVFRVGAPYRITVAGQPLALMSANAMAATGSAHRGAGTLYNGRIPALFALPAGAREARIELQALPYLPAGVVGLAMGPTHLLLPEHTASVRSVVGYADAASGVVLVIGLLSFLLWLPRRRDLNLLWLALACGLWGSRGLIYFNNAVPGPPLLFEQLNPANALLAATALAAAAIHLVRPPGARRRPFIGLAALAGALLFGLAGSGLAGTGAPIARTLAQVGGTAMICWLGLEFWRQRRRLPTRHTAALLACVVALLSCVVHDLLVVAGVLPPTSQAYVFWGFIVVLVGFALISGEYVVATLNRAERSNEELERRVAQKSGELAASYERLRESERDAARTQERERLLRDMHDGLGAQLMTALRGVERGALGREQLTQSLQDSLDELRLLMDSADMAHYLPGALAAWRNRWDHRLAAAGVTLEWRIDGSVDEVQLPGEQVLQVMRILQEAVTNVVKHARASRMVLDARVEGEGDAATLVVAVRDDGGGAPAAGAPVSAGSRGLHNMRHRAGQLGGALTVGPAPEGGTAVVLRVPLALDQATSPRRAASIAASARDEMPSLR
jgi:signal transduction histidine kinase